MQKGKYLFLQATALRQKEKAKNAVTIEEAKVAQTAVAKAKSLIAHEDWFTTISDEIFDKTWRFFDELLREKMTKMLL